MKEPFNCTCVYCWWILQLVTALNKLNDDLTLDFGKYLILGTTDLLNSVLTPALVWLLVDY